MNRQEKRFVVSIHDVAPSSEDEITRILKALRPRVGTVMSAAVVPIGFDRGRSVGLAALVRSNCREIALHGYSHQGRNRFHPLAVVTKNSVEFMGLSSAETQARLERGQEILRNVFGRTASVLIPPAWWRGAVTPMLAENCRLCVLAGLTAFETGARRCPLAIYSWDWGRLGLLGYAGELFGHIRHQLCSATPCVVLHPCDVSRNFLGRALAIIDRLLREGFSPATFTEISAAALEWPRSGSLANENSIAETNLCHHSGTE